MGNCCGKSLKEKKYKIPEPEPLEEPSQSVPQSRKSSFQNQLIKTEILPIVNPINNLEPENQNSPIKNNPKNSMLCSQQEFMKFDTIKTNTNYQSELTNQYLSKNTEFNTYSNNFDSNFTKKH